MTPHRALRLASAILRESPGDESTSAAECRAAADALDALAAAPRPMDTLATVDAVRLLADDYMFDTRRFRALVKVEAELRRLTGTAYGEIGGAR